jgi:hypothetical protein
MLEVLILLIILVAIGILFGARVAAGCVLVVIALAVIALIVVIGILFNHAHQ